MEKRVILRNASELDIGSNDISIHINRMCILDFEWLFHWPKYFSHK